jgi:hypothetical protein
MFTKEFDYIQTFVFLVKIFEPFVVKKISYLFSDLYKYTFLS